MNNPYTIDAGTKRMMRAKAIDLLNKLAGSTLISFDGYTILRNSIRHLQRETL